MNKKMSYVAAIQASLNGELTEEVTTRLNELIAQMNKRNNASSTAPTKTQKENMNIKDEILECMSVGGAHTISEWQEIAPAMKEYSNQKLTALLNQLVADGKVVKTTEARKSYFQLEGEAGIK